MRYFVFPSIASKGAKRVSRCVAMTLMLVVTGCSQEPASERLDNYHTRLARVFDFSPSPVAPVRAVPAMPVIPHWPETGKSEQLDLLDFMSLYGCELQLVVAQQNASLGRFARSSQQLLNHLRFLHVAPDCIDSLRKEDKPALAAQLEQVFVTKQQHLAAYIWQALLGGEEARAFWKRPVVLADYPEQVGRAPAQAIAQMRDLASRWLAGEWDAGWSELEQVLAEFRTGDGGALLKSWEILQRRLSLIDADLAQWQRTAARCVQARANFDARILDNVIRKFFVAEVQVWAAQLSQRYYALMVPMEALENLLVAGEPPAYRDWRQHRMQFLEVARQSMRVHVHALQGVQKLCQAPEQG